MENIARLTGIETTLRQVGITEQDLDRLADDAMLQTRLLGNNPRTVTRADARAIYNNSHKTGERVGQPWNFSVIKKHAAY